MSSPVSTAKVPVLASEGSVRILDACGALLSGACAVHCALTPLLITALPALASHGAETGLRRVLILLGIVGVGLGAWVHKSRDALLPLGAAITLALAFELHWVNLAIEVFPSMLLSACLITAHALNSRACHKKSLCCAADRCEEPFWGLLGAASKQTANRTPIVLSAAALLHAFVISLVAHRGDYTALARPLAAAEVQIDLVEPAVVAAPAREAAPEAPAPARAPASAPAPALPASSAAPVAFERVLGAPDAAAPVKFAHVLGAPARSGPSGSASGAPRADGRSSGGVAPADQRAAAGPALARELSRRPVPPAGLESAIRAHYPATARAQKLEGTGSARLLVSPAGSIVSAVPDAESAVGSGFARACADAMNGTSGWGAPLARDGQAVSTWIHFTCEFAIRH